MASLKETLYTLQTAECAYISYIVLEKHIIQTYMDSCREIHNTKCIRILVYFKETQKMHMCMLSLREHIKHT